MKNLLFALALIVPFILVAQTEGTITYTQTVRLNIEAPEGMEEMFKNMPKSRSSDKTLIFKDMKSLFITDNNEDFKMENTAHSGMGEAVFQIKIQEPDNQVYSDFAEGKVVEQKELLGKKFLIKDELMKYDWKVTSERRKILEYECMKATAMEDTTAIVAWFTPQIPLSMGPSEFNGLPGAILMVEINHGDRLLIAKEVAFNKIEDIELIIPSKGKKVNRSQFIKIEEEKMAEQMAINGGSGVRMIIRNN